jgi:hypothetical protein
MLSKGFSLSLIGAGSMYAIKSSAIWLLEARGGKSFGVAYAVPAAGQSVNFKVNVERSTGFENIFPLKDSV